MRHTLKAVFDRQSDAQHVLDELLASGYLRADLTLSNTSTSAAREADDGPASGAHATGMRTMVQHAVDRLLRSGRHEQAQAYDEPPMRGGHLVTLLADSEPDAERAVGIIQRFGPVGIEDIHDDRDSADARQPKPGTDIGGAAASYPPGTAPRAMLHYTHENPRYFGTQDAESPPVGNTFQEPSGKASEWDKPDDDGTGLPRAWPASGSASDGTDTPAIRYGSDMRESDANRNRSWDEAEPSLKAGWAARHPGLLSAWDNVKDAVRHGWERVKS